MKCFLLLQSFTIDIFCNTFNAVNFSSRASHSLLVLCLYPMILVNTVLKEFLVTETIFLLDFSFILLLSQLKSSSEKEVSDSNLPLNTIRLANDIAVFDFGFLAGKYCGVSHCSCGNPLC